MANEKSASALFLGNRGIFPAPLIAEARKELREVLKGLGHNILMLAKRRCAGGPKQ